MGKLILYQKGALGYLLFHWPSLCLPMFSSADAVYNGNASRLTPVRKGSSASMPDLSARQSVVGQKGVYEVTSGLVTLYVQPSKQSATLGILRGGVRFFGTPYQIGTTQWLQVSVKNALAATCGQFTKACESRRLRPRSITFASNDVGLNVYTRGSTLPHFADPAATPNPSRAETAPAAQTTSASPPQNATVGSGEWCWVLDSPQYLKRLRSVEWHQRGAGEGIVAPGWKDSPLKHARHELQSPMRHADPKEPWRHSGSRPILSGALRKTFQADVNCRRVKTTNPMCALEYVGPAGMDGHPAVALR